jgi:RNA polymerase sigma factor (sigma-70 family)
MPRGDTRVEPDDAEAVAVRAAVAALPLAQRQAVILRYFADLPIREVASVMRCPENTVKTHTRRALESLRASDLHDDEPSSCELEVGVEEAR